MKDLPKFKAGDRVWHLRTGEWGILEEVESNSTSLRLRIENTNEIFYCTIHGKLHEMDVNPVIFHTEQTLNFEKPKWIPKEGELCYFWDDAHHRCAIIGRFKEDIEDNKYGYKTDNGAFYKYCCPITEIPPHLL